MKKEKKARKKLSKKAKIILISSISTIIAAIVVVGIYLLVNLNQAPVEIEEGEAKYKTYYKEVTNEGTPADYSVIDNIGMALWKIEHVNEYKSNTSGEAVAAGVTQAVIDSKIVKDDTIMLETISSGLVKMAKQRYLTKDQILMRDGEVNGNSASWDNGVTPECVSKKTYMKRYGWWPNQAMGYIVCPETMLNEPKILAVGDGTYTIEMDLNPDGEYAPYWYKREIITNSGSTKIPEFHSIHIKMNIDSTWLIQYVDVEESYTVKTMGIEANTKTNCHTEYSYSDVSFDETYFNYFQNFKHLTPPADSEGDDLVSSTEDDNLTILVSSLQKPDGSDLVLDATIKALDNNLEGLVALNITDVENIKVYAKLNGLYVEYTDSLYVSIGGYKIKCNIDEMKNIISPLLASNTKENDNSSELDTSQIMAAFNNGIKTVDGNNITLEVTLDLMGIKIDLTLNVVKNSDESYTLKSANAIIDISGTKIELTIKETDKQFTYEVDKSAYQDLKNIEYIVKNIETILKTKKLEASFDMALNDVNIEAHLYLDFNDDKNIKINANINLKYGQKNTIINLTYLDNIIYLNYGNIFVSLSLQEILNIVDKYSDNTSTNMLDLSKLDIAALLGKVLSLDFNKMLVELKLNERDSLVKLNLEDLDIGIKNVALDISLSQTLDVHAVIDDLDMNLNIMSSNKDIAIDSSIYTKLTGLENVIDNIGKIINEKKLTTNVNFELMDVVISGTVELDLTNELKIHADLEALINNTKMPVDVYYFNETKTLYLSVNEIKAKLDLGKYINQIEMPKLSLDNILETIINLDIEEFLAGLKEADDGIELDINISKLDTVVPGLIDSTKPIKLGVSIKDDIEFSIANEFILNGTLKSGCGEFKTDFEDYKDLSSLVDSIVDIVNIVKEKKLSAKIDTVINLNELVGIDLNAMVTGTINIDFTDSLKLEANLVITLGNTTLPINVILIDNKLYIESELLNVCLGLDEINEIIEAVSNGEIKENNNLSIDTILDVIKAIVLEDEKTITVDLSSLSEELGKLTLGVDKTNLNVNLKGINANIIISNEVKEILTPVGSFINKDDVLALVNNVKSIVDIVNEKKLSLALNLELKDINVNGTVNLDFTDSFKLSANLNIKYNDLELALNVYYLNDILYLDFNDNHVSMTLSDLMTDEIDVSSLLTSLKNLDLNELLMNLEITKTSIGINLDLNKLGIDLSKLEGILDLDKELKLNLDFTDSIKLTVVNSFNLEATLSSLNDEIKVDENNYINIDALKTSIIDIVNIIKGDAFSITLNGEFDLGALLPIDKRITINSYIKASIKDGLKLDASIVLLIENIKATINIKIINDIVYISIGDSVIKISIDEIPSLIDNIKNKFENDKNESINVEDVLSNLINSLNITSNGLSLNLSSVVTKLGKLELNTIENGFDITLMGNDEENSTTILNLGVGISSIDNVDITIPSNINIDSDNILDLVDIIKNLIDEIKEKNSYYLDLDLAIDTGMNSTIWTIGGYVYIENIKSIDDLKVDAKIILNEYKNRNLDGKADNTHTISVIIIDKMLYITYGNNPAEPNSLVKVYTEFSTITNLIDKVVSILPSLSTLGITLGNDLNVNTDEIIDLTSFINNISINNGDIVIGLTDSNKHKMNISLETSDNNSIFMLSVSNLFVSYDSDIKYTKLDIRNLSLLDNVVEVVAPVNLDGYYDITSLEYLVEGLLNIAKYKSFEISGVATLSAIKLVNIDVPVDIKMSINDNGFEVMVHIDMSNAPKFNAAGVTITPKQLYYYYRDGYVYIRRCEGKKGDGDKYELKVTLDTFFDDLAYYILDFGMNLGPTIMEQVNTPAKGDGFVDAGKVINEYSYNNGIINVNLNMERLTGNSSLGALQAQIELKNCIDDNDEESYYLYGVKSLSFDMVNVINISLNDPLTLKNITTDSDNKLIYKEVDFKDYDAYLDGYKYPVDIIYQNGKIKGKVNHTISFIYGFDIESYQFRGQAGSRIILKDYEFYTYNDILYHFEGWYLDEGYKTLFEETEIGNSSYVCFAKWKAVNKNTLTINSMDNTLIYDTYSGEDISKYLNFKLSNFDGIMYRPVGIYLDEEFNTEFLDNEMPDSNLTLFVKWAKVEIDLVVDNSIKYTNINDSTEINLDGMYYLKLDNNYFGYESDAITSTLLLRISNSISYLDERGRIELVSIVPSDYYTISFDYDYHKFNQNPFISVSLNNSTDMNNNYLPYSKYKSYDINYWYNDNGEYHNGNSNEITHENQTLYAYYATCEYLSYGQSIDDNNNEVVSVNGFNYKGSEITVILPKYVFVNGEYKILNMLSEFDEDGEKYSYFTNNESLKEIYFNDGFTTICNNAFKGCTKLSKVVFSSTVDTIRTNVTGKETVVDAFYIGVKTTINFYIKKDSTLASMDKKNWYSYKGNFFNTKYYHDSNSFIIYDNSINEEVRTAIKNI